MSLPTNLNRFGGGKKAKSYYCDVEYIHFDGACRIDTGIYSASDIKVEIECRAATNSGFNNGLIGGREALGTNSFSIWKHLNSRTEARFDLGNTQAYSYSSQTPNVWYNLIKDGPDNYVNGGKQTSNSYTGSFESTTTTITLGAVRTGTSTFTYISFTGDVKYCKMWKAGVLVRDFIPVLDTNNAPCFYDKVSGQLFYNQGTGDFTAGREIHYVEYITSDGNQYIDTGVNPTFTMTAEIKCQSTVASVCPIGAGGTGSNNRWQIIASSEYYSGRIGNKTITNQNARNTDLVVAKLDGQTNTLTVNGVSVNLTGSTAGVIPSDNTLALFRRNMYSGSTAYAKFVGDIYWNKIWDNDVLIRDYEAAVDENGVGFMFDRVTHTIYDNAGTGTFTYP